MAARYLVQTGFLLESTCNFCPGCQWLTMSYTAILYTFMALALALVNIGHLSLVPAITSQ